MLNTETALTAPVADISEKLPKRPSIPPPASVAAPATNLQQDKSATKLRPRRLQKVNHRPHSSIMPPLRRHRQRSARFNAYNYTIGSAWPISLPTPSSSQVIPSSLLSTFSVYTEANAPSTLAVCRQGIEIARAEEQISLAQTHTIPRVYIQGKLDVRFIRLCEKWREWTDNQFPTKHCTFSGTLMQYRDRKFREIPIGTDVPVLSTYSITPFAQQLSPEQPMEYLSCKRCFEEPSSTPGPLTFGPWPEELLAVRFASRMFLSPMTLQTNLGRTQSHAAGNRHNAWSTYRTLTGTMYSIQNARAAALFSGSLGAYLESSTLRPANRGHNRQELETAKEWLLANDSLYLKPDVQQCLNMSSNVVFPTAARGTTRNCS